MDMHKIHLEWSLFGLRLAVFFPSLAFGWLRSATGSIVAPVFFHASCNLISKFMHDSFFLG